MSVSLTIAADHAAFEGHFPDLPLLPGAALLDEAIHAIEKDLGLPSCIWDIANVKFLSPVGPGTVLRIDHARTATGAIRFTVSAPERIVATGQLSAPP